MISVLDTTSVFSPIANNSGLSQPIPRDNGNVDTLKKENEEKVTVDENIPSENNLNFNNVEFVLFFSILKHRIQLDYSHKFLIK